MVGVTFQLSLLSPLSCVTVGYPEFVHSMFVTFTPLTCVSFSVSSQNRSVFVPRWRSRSGGVLDDLEKRRRDAGGGGVPLLEILVFD